MAIQNILEVYQTIFVLAIVIWKPHLTRGPACSYLLWWFTCFMQVCRTLSFAVVNQSFPHFTYQDLIQFLHSFLNLLLRLLLLEAVFEYIFLLSSLISFHRPKLWAATLQIHKPSLHIVMQHMPNLHSYLLILKQSLALLQKDFFLSCPTLIQFILDLS